MSLTVICMWSMMGSIENLQSSGAAPASRKSQLALVFQDVPARRWHRAALPVRHEALRLIERDCRRVQVRDIQYEPADAVRACPCHDEVHQPAADTGSADLRRDPHRDEPCRVGLVLIACA